MTKENDTQPNKKEPLTLDEIHDAVRGLAALGAMVPYAEEINKIDADLKAAKFTKAQRDSVYRYVQKLIASDDVETLDKNYQKALGKYDKIAEKLDNKEDIEVLQKLTRDLHAAITKDLKKD